MKNQKKNSTVNIQQPLFDDLTVNEDYIPDKHKYSFQTKFSYIKRHLRIKKSRKTNIDGILKKCKSKFFKVIHQALKLCLNFEFHRPPQDFIKNITIDINKQILNKKIVDFYHDYNLIPTFNEIISKNLIKKDKKEVFNEIANSSIIELYDQYINSEKYKKDEQLIFHKEGKKFTILYRYVSKNFISYYLLCSPHKKKKKSNGPRKDIFNTSDESKSSSSSSSNLKTKNYRDIKK